MPFHDFLAFRVCVTQYKSILGVCLSELALFYDIFSLLHTFSVLLVKCHREILSSYPFGIVKVSCDWIPTFSPKFGGFSAFATE